jgi:hypothetical protein
VPSGRGVASDDLVDDRGDVGADDVGAFADRAYLKEYVRDSTGARIRSSTSSAAANSGLLAAMATVVSVPITTTAMPRANASVEAIPGPPAYFLSSPSVTVTSAQSPSCAPLYVLLRQVVLISSSP